MEYPGRKGILIIPTQLHNLRKAGRQIKTGSFGKVVASRVVRLAVAVLCLLLTFSNPAAHITCKTQLGSLTSWACRYRDILQQEAPMH